MKAKYELDRLYFNDDEDGFITLYDETKMESLGRHKILYEEELDREYIIYKNQFIYLDDIYEI